MLLPGPVPRGRELGLCRGGEARGWGMRGAWGGCARRSPRGREMPGPRKLWSAGLERRGQTPPLAAAAAGLAPENPPSAAARAVQRGASGRQPGKARGAILLPTAGEQRRVPSSQRSCRGQNSLNFPRAGAAAAPGASGRARWVWTALRGEDGASLCSVLLAQSGCVRASS